MEITFDKYIGKEELVICFIPTIVFGKDDDSWTLVAAWLCFTINIEF